MDPAFFLILSGLKVSQVPATTERLPSSLLLVLPPLLAALYNTSHKGGLNSLWQVSLEFTANPHPKIYQKLQTKPKEETLHLKMDLFPWRFNSFFFLESTDHLETTVPEKICEETKQNKTLRPMCHCIPEISTDGNCTEESGCQSRGETVRDTGDLRTGKGKKSALSLAQLGS